MNKNSFPANVYSCGKFLNKNSNNNASSYLERDIILDQINFHIKNIFKIIQNKQAILKYNAFLEIKDYLKKKKLNLIKAEIIYENFKYMILKITKIYQKFQRLKYSRFFTKWKNYSSFRKKYNQFKLDIEKNSEKKYEKDLKSFEVKLKENEDENNEFKKTIQKNAEIESGILKTISEFEEKENNYIYSIKKLEEEKTALQKEIDIVSHENNKSQKVLKNIDYTIIGNNNHLSNNNGKEQRFLNENLNENSNHSPLVKKDYIQKLEEKLKEKEGQILKLKQENSEKDNKINIFMSEMAEIIQVHEKNSKNVQINNALFFL